MELDKFIEKEIAIFSDKLGDYKSKNLNVFASSSFQTHSIPMLHVLSQIDKNIPVYFLNTGYHFPETLNYRDQITELFGLKLVNIESPISRIRQRDSLGNLMYTSDPDQCCYFNKTLPMEPILSENDVWITGVRKDQNANRSTFDYEIKGAHNTVRFHPMLNWSNQMIWHYIKVHALPHHTLENKGYMSIGCEPCTRKMTFEDVNGREGRWQGMKKTECGLHTELVGK